MLIIFLYKLNVENEKSPLNDGNALLFSNLLSTKGTFVLTLPDMSPKKKKIQSLLLSNHTKMAI